jgi:hypothetical protein
MSKVSEKILWLEKKHKHQHQIVESLEAEKAPEETIKRAKIEKLKLKDEIENLKRMVS